MEADCFFSSSCPQKVSPGHEFSVATKQSLQQLSFEKKVISLGRSITLRADARRL